MSDNTPPVLQAFDSARWQLIPGYAQAIFPYADGRYAWSNSHFPKAQWRYITVLGNPAVDIIDFEPGCVFNVSTLQNWAHARSQNHQDITVYTYRAAYETVANALKKYDWHLWLATLDGTQLTEYEGKLLRACQYTDRGGLYDISNVYDSHWLYPSPQTAPDHRPQYVNVEVAHWNPTNAPWNSTEWGIASHYGISVDELRAANPGIGTVIYPGQVIKVP